jgi:hypothetical protein
MENYTRYLIPLALIVFLIYRRIKRTIGFQKYIPAVMITRIVLFSLVSSMVLFFTVTQTISLIADIAGISIGLSLLYLAIKNTVFEKREGGLYYRTHIWIELTIMILFLGRFIYRFYGIFTSQISSHSPEEMPNSVQNLRDPLTSSVFLVICAYYIGYFTYILKHGKKALQKVNTTVESSD